MPPEHFEVLKLLWAHLRRVIAAADTNKMTAANLAVVFAPTLLRSPKGAAADLSASGLVTTALAAIIGAGPGSTIGAVFTGRVAPTSPGPAISNGKRMTRMLSYSPARKGGPKPLDVLTSTLMDDPREAFKMFDEDNSGTIDKDEFVVMMRSQGFALDDVEASQLFRTIDADGSGQIEFPEFQKALAHKVLESEGVTALSARERVDFCAAPFADFITGDDGKLKREELEYICRNMGGGNQLTEDEITVLMNELAIESGGTLDTRHFSELMAPTLAPQFFASK